MALTNIRVADLRKELTDKNLRWQLDPRLKDADFVPRRALGANTNNLPKADQIGRIDLASKLRTELANPFLLERRGELGFRATRPLLTPTPPVAGPPTPDTEGPGLAISRPLGLPVAAGLAHATSVDWRNRWGWPWITTVQDQDGCNACWAFAATALVESMVRIEHAVWSKRSEGDVHDGIGKHCADLGNIGEALDWIKAHGLADPACYPYKTDNSAYTPTADRSGRTVKISDYTWVGDLEQQKTWIDTVGPLAVCFAVYDDFYGYGSGVYHRSTLATNKLAGYHCVLIVGYDEVQRCWLCKNSWGPGWGDHGYFRIGYGEADIDTWAKAGVEHTNPDPWTKRRLHGGAMVESGNGALHRNFEMTASLGSQVKHWWRDNTAAGFPWHEGPVFGEQIAACPTLTATTYNRNFELVSLTTGRRLVHWFFDQSAARWVAGPTFGPTDADGLPGFCQSDYGAPGNFEVVVRTADGRLTHWWRLNGPPWTWSESTRFASNVRFSGPTLVQTRARQLDVVCVLNDGRMQLWRRDDPHGFTWGALDTFGSGIESPPCMVEGQFSAADENTQGNYELCVASGGRIQHWWRANTGDRLWRNSATFGHDVQAVASLIEGSFGFNLEVIALRFDRKLQHYWRDGSGWHEGVIIGTT